MVPHSLWLPSGPEHQLTNHIAFYHLGSNLTRIACGNFCMFALLKIGGFFFSSTPISSAMLPSKNVSPRCVKEYEFTRVRSIITLLRCRELKNFLLNNTTHRQAGVRTFGTLLMIQRLIIRLQNRKYPSSNFLKILKLL